MPTQYTWMVISVSGHHYEVSIKPLPHTEKRVLDPCDKDCWKVWDRESKELMLAMKESSQGTPRKRKPRVL